MSQETEFKIKFQLDRETFEPPCKLAKVCDCFEQIQKLKNIKKDNFFLYYKGIFLNPEWNLSDLVSLGMKNDEVITVFCPNFKYIEMYFDQKGKEELEKELPVIAIKNEEHEENKETDMEQTTSLSSSTSSHKNATDESTPDYEQIYQEVRNEIGEKHVEEFKQYSKWTNLPLEVWFLVYFFIKKKKSLSPEAAISQTKDLFKKK